MPLPPVDPVPPATRLFVYGTLKRGLCRHGALAAERYLGETRTAPRYRMVNHGSYPGLYEDPVSGLSIHGELWEVGPACLAQLDEVEGVAEGLYERRPIQLATPAAGPAEAYFTLAPIDGLPDCGARWS